MKTGVYGIMFFGIKAQEEMEDEIWCGKMVCYCFMLFALYSVQFFLLHVLFLFIFC